MVKGIPLLPFSLLTNAFTLFASMFANSSSCADSFPPTVHSDKHNKELAPPPLIIQLPLRHVTGL